MTSGFSKDFGPSSSADGSSFSSYLSSLYLYLLNRIYNTEFSLGGKTCFWSLLALEGNVWLFRCKKENNKLLTLSFCCLVQSGKCEIYQYQLVGIQIVGQKTLIMSKKNLKILVALRELQSG